MPKRIERAKKLSNLDPVLSLSVLALLVLGIVMVYSASSLMASERFGDGAFFLKKQLRWIFLGLGAMGIAFFVKLRVLRILSFPFLLAITLLLVLTCVTSAGVTAKHATRWIQIQGITFQPSEFVKPILILYVAAYIARKGEKIQDFFRGLFPLLLTVSMVLFLILRQPDFGTTVSLSLAIFIMLFVSRARLPHLGGLALLGMTAGYFLMMNADYRKKRLLSFLNPWQDPKGSGFQIIQSFIAFRHGGIQGQGLGDGTQKLLYLPEAHTDFIFSVIAEELGIVGSLLVIFLFACIVIQGFRLALRLKDTFASQVAIGFTALIGIQALLNMAVVMALLPTKGLTLPFVSYGGSSMISMLVCVGVLLSLSSTVSVAGKMAKRRLT